MEEGSCVGTDKEKNALIENHSPVKGSVATMATADSGSPAKPTDEAAEPSEEAFNDLEDSSRASSESPLTITTNAPSEVILTEEIIKEEEEWQKEGEAEEKEELSKRQQLWALMSEDTRGERYARLQYLLRKSNMYTEYLIQRMESQRDEEKARRQRMMKRKENKEKKEEEKMKKGSVCAEPETKEKGSSENETKSVLSTKPEASRQDKNIPKSPAVGDTAETIKSPRRKLPAPKSKSAVSMETTGSPIPEKENDNPEERLTGGSQKEIPASPSVGEFEDFEECFLECLGDYTEERKGPFDPPEPTRRGRKRKAAEESTSLIVNFFQPVTKRKKPDEDGNLDKTKATDKSKKKNGAAEEDTKKTEKAKKTAVIENDPEPSIEEDGTLVRPALLTGGELRQYQVEGLNWLKVLYENGVNGILADEMGLGKTIQCIALIAHLGFSNIPGPFMVVAPLSTLPNWKSEFKRFAPQVPVLFYHGIPEERAKLRNKIKKLHMIAKDTYMKPVVITSYEITMRDRKHLQDFEWRYMIVDEGHRIKNAHCRLIKELRHYKNTHRLLLTGTPLQNNLAELWSLLNFLLPEIFDDLGSFESWFDIAAISEEGADEAIVEAEQRKNVLSMLHQILTPFMLRRVKADVDLLIPPKKELIVYAPMTIEQQEFYTATVDRTILTKIEEKNSVEEDVEMSEAGRPRRRSTKKKVNYQAMMASENDAVVPKNKRKDEEELESWINEMWEYNNTCVQKEEKKKVSQVTIRLQNIMMQLRKCCNHPYLLEYPLDKATGEFKMDENIITKCGKMIILDKMLTDLKKRGHKVLVFSQMTKMLDILEDYCVVRKLNYCRLDGSCSVENRHEQMDSFNTDPSRFVFLLSTRAGGLGINLTAADTVIIYDSDWNPQCDLQAQDRCHRIGQTRPVVVYRFVTANTIDQKIVERAAAKRKLEKMIIHKGKFKTGIRNFSKEIKPLSPEELMDLLKSRDHCKEINQGRDAGISDQELNQLLDRSDLCEEFERTTEALKGQTQGKSQGKTGVKKVKETKKSARKEKDSQLFQVVDYSEGGSTLETNSEADEDSQNITEKTTEANLEVSESV